MAGTNWGRRKSGLAQSDLKLKFQLVLVLTRDLDANETACINRAL
jgi:hypothetical protein